MGYKKILFLLVMFSFLMLGCVNQPETKTEGFQNGLFSVSEDGTMIRARLFDDTLGLDRYSYLLPEDATFTLMTTTPMAIKHVDTSYSDDHTKVDADLSTSELTLLNQHVHNDIVPVDEPYVPSSVKTAMSFKNKRSTVQKVQVGFDFKYPGSSVIVSGQEFPVGKDDVLIVQLFGDELFYNGRSVKLDKKVSKVFIPKSGGYYSVDFSDLDQPGVYSELSVTRSGDVLKFHLVVKSEVPPGETLSFDPSFGISYDYPVKSVSTGTRWARIDSAVGHLDDDELLDLVLVSDGRVYVGYDPLSNLSLSEAGREGVYGFGRAVAIGNLGLGGPEDDVVVSGVDKVVAYPDGDWEHPITLDMDGLSFIDYLDVDDDYLYLGAFTSDEAGVTGHLYIYNISEFDPNTFRVDDYYKHYCVHSENPSLVFVPSGVVRVKDSLIISYPYKGKDGNGAVYQVPISSEERDVDLDEHYLFKLVGEKNESLGRGMTLLPDGSLLVSSRDRLYQVWLENQSKRLLFSGVDGFGSPMIVSGDVVLIGSPVENSVYMFRYEDGSLRLLKVFTSTHPGSKFGSQVLVLSDDPDRFTVGITEQTTGTLYSITTSLTPCVDLYDPSTWGGLHIEDGWLLISGDVHLCPGEYHLSESDPVWGLSFMDDGASLDCDGAVLVGDGEGIIIWIGSVNSAVVRDCVIKNFSTAIEVEGATNVQIINNTMFNGGDHGIYIYHAGNISITNNTIYNLSGSYSQGIFIDNFQGGNCPPPKTNVMVSGNEIYNITTTSSLSGSGVGILIMDGCPDIMYNVSLNEISNCSVYGIMLHHMVNGGLIQDNRVCGNRLNDIFIQASSSSLSGDNTCDTISPDGSTVTCSRSCRCNECGSANSVRITPEFPNDIHISNGENLTCSVDITVPNGGCTSGQVIFNWTVYPYMTPTTGLTPPGCANQTITVPFTVYGSGEVSSNYSLNSSDHGCTTGSLFFHVINCTATVVYNNPNCENQTLDDAVCVGWTGPIGGDLDAHICTSPNPGSPPSVVCDDDSQYQPVQGPTTLYCTFNQTALDDITEFWTIGGFDGYVNITFYDQNGNILQTRQCNPSNYFGPGGCGVYECNSPVCYQPNTVHCAVTVVAANESYNCPLTGAVVGDSSGDIRVSPPEGIMDVVIYADGEAEPDRGDHPYATRESVFVCLASGSRDHNPLSGDDWEHYKVTFYTYDEDGNRIDLQRRSCNSSIPDPYPSYHYVSSLIPDPSGCNVYMDCVNSMYCIKGRDVYCEFNLINPNDALPPHGGYPPGNSSGPIRVHNTPPVIGPPIVGKEGNYYTCEVNLSSYYDVDDLYPAEDPAYNVSYYWQWLGNASDPGDVYDPANENWLNITPCSNMWDQPGWLHIYPESKEIHKTVVEGGSDFCHPVLEGTTYDDVRSFFEDAFCTNLSQIHGSGGGTVYIDWYDVASGSYPPNCDENYRGYMDPGSTVQLNEYDQFFEDMAGFYFGQPLKFHKFTVRCCVRVEDSPADMNGPEQNWSNVICSTPVVCRYHYSCGNCTVKEDADGNVQVVCTDNSSCVSGDGLQCYQYEYYECDGERQMITPVEVFQNGTNAVDACIGCGHNIYCKKVINDTTGEWEYYYHDYDGCSGNLTEYKLNLSDPLNLSWAMDNCDMVNCESKYGSVYGPKNATTGDWRYYEIPDVESVHVFAPDPDPHDNIAGQYSVLECEPADYQHLDEPVNTTEHVCLPEGDPDCSNADYIEYVNYTINYHTHEYRWKYVNLWDPLFWEECGHGPCPSGDDLFPGYREYGLITHWREGLNRINCSQDYGTGTVNLCKKHDMVSCDYRERLNYTKKVVRIGRWGCSQVGDTILCDEYYNSTHPYVHITTEEISTENGSEDDFICGLSRGIIINNTEPEVLSVDIYNATGGAYLPPITLLPPVPDDVYAVCNITYHDWDTHVPDESDTILYMFNVTVGGTSYTVRNYDTDPNLTLSDLSGSGITQLTSGDSITCCVKMNDTYWQSKWSEPVCNTLPVGNRPPVCVVTNFTVYDCCGGFRCEASCIDPDGDNIKYYHFRLFNESGVLLDYNDSSDSVWEVTYPMPVGGCGSCPDGWNKCHNLTCVVVGEDEPPPGLLPAKSKPANASDRIENCPPVLRPCILVATGDMTTGVIYVDPGYCDRNGDEPYNFVWNITYTNSSGSTITITNTTPPGVILSYDDPLDGQGEWTYYPDVMGRGPGFIAVWTGGHLRNVSPYINLSALPSGGLYTGESLRVCVSTRDQGGPGCTNEMSSCITISGSHPIPILNVPVIYNLSINGSDCPGQELSCIANVSHLGGASSLEVNFTLYNYTSTGGLGTGLVEVASGSTTCRVGSDCSHVVWNSGFSDTHLDETYVCNVSVSDGVTTVWNTTNATIDDSGCPTPGPGPITSCMVINLPGVYTLATNLTITDYSSLIGFKHRYPEGLACCIIINSSDVVLDLNGSKINTSLACLGGGCYRLTDSSGSSYYIGEVGGICGEDLDNVSVMNGSVELFDRGIVMLNVRNLTLANLSISGNDDLAYGISASGSGDDMTTGISLCSVDNTTVSNVSVIKYRGGLQVLGSDNITVINSSFMNDSHGIETYGYVLRGLCGDDTHNLRVINSSFHDNMEGIHVNHLYDSEVRGCYFDRCRASGIHMYGTFGNLRILDNKFGYTGIGSGRWGGYGGITFVYVYNMTGPVWIISNYFEGNDIGVHLDTSSFPPLYSNESIYIEDNQILKGRVGVEIDPSVNNVSVIFKQNNITNNTEYGVLFNHPETHSPSIIYYFDYGSTVGDLVLLNLSDGSSGADRVILLPVCGGAYTTSHTSHRYAYLLPDERMSDYGRPDFILPRCYQPNNVVLPLFERGCYNQSVNGTYYAPNVDVSLEVYRFNVSDLSFTTSPVWTGSYSMVINSTSRWRVYLPINVTSLGFTPSDGRYVVKGSLTCDYPPCTGPGCPSDFTLDIPPQVIDVGSSCGSNPGYRIKHMSVSPNGIHVYPSPNISTIFMVVVPDGLGYVSPVVEVSDVDCSSGSCTLSSTSSFDPVWITNPPFVYNISMDNDYVCYNGWDVNDTVYYEPALSPYNRTVYNSVTCEPTLSYSRSISPNSPCSGECPATVCSLRISGLRGCYEPGDTIRFNVNDDYSGSRTSSYYIGHVHVLNSSGDSIFDCRYYDTLGLPSVGGSCVDLSDVNIPECSVYDPTTSSYPLCANESGGEFHGFLVYGNMSLCTGVYNVSVIAGVRGVPLSSDYTLLRIASDNVILDLNDSVLIGNGSSGSTGISMGKVSCSGYLCRAVPSDRVGKVAVMRGEVIGFRYGLMVNTKPYDNMVSDLLLHGNGYGIYIQHAEDTYFTYVDSVCNDVGVYTPIGFELQNTIFNTVNLCCNDMLSNYPSGSGNTFVNVSCPVGSSWYSAGRCDLTCPDRSDPSCVCGSSLSIPGVGLARRCSGEVEIPVDTSMIGSYTIVVNESPNSCDDVSHTIRVASDCSPEPPEECDCALSIDNLTWTTWSPLSEGACENDTVYLNLSAEFSGDCSHEDLRDTNVIVTDPDGHVFLSGEVGYDGDNGWFTFSFDEDDPYGEYTILVEKDDCDPALAKLKHIHCSPTVNCSGLWEVCGGDSNLSCCDIARMQEMTHYPIDLSCVDGMCCVPLGGRCYEEYEMIINRSMCCEGVCIDGVCQLPETNETKVNKTKLNETILPENQTTFECSPGPCNRTGECCVGYCDAGMCVLPPGKVSVFGLWPKPGCAPYEMTGILGFIICDLMWLYILAVASVGAYYSRKEENKMIPILMFILPILIGLLTYPFVGLLTGLVGLFFVMYRRQKPRKPESGEGGEVGGPGSGGSSGPRGPGGSEPFGFRPPRLPDVPGSGTDSSMGTFRGTSGTGTGPDTRTGFTDLQDER